MLDPRAARPAGPGERYQPLLRTMIGDALRRNRLGQRRTLADVARAARVSMPYLSEVERGRKEASSEVLAAICEALRIDLSYLLAEVWRDLAEFRQRQARRNRVVRLGILSDRAGQLGTAPGPADQPGSIPGNGLPQGGPSDATCLLAA
jgi:transcriptional regulator with XRE-family HTH domain